MLKLKKNASHCICMRTFRPLPLRTRLDSRGLGPQTFRDDLAQTSTICSQKPTANGSAITEISSRGALQERFGKKGFRISFQEQLYHQRKGHLMLQSVSYSAWKKSRNLQKSLQTPIPRNTSELPKSVSSNYSNKQRRMKSCSHKSESSWRVAPKPGYKFQQQWETTGTSETYKMVSFTREAV